MCPGINHKDTKPYYYMKMLGIIKKKTLFSFLKTYLRYVPRISPVNHRHTELMRQSHVLYLCKNNFRTEFKCARTQSSSRCMLSLISGKLLPSQYPLTVHRPHYKIQRPLYTFIESIALPHAVIVIKIMLQICSHLSMLLGLFLL